MRKYILLIMMALVCCLTVSAQSPYKKEGKTYTLEKKSRKAKAEPTTTGRIVVVDGTSYDVFMSASGSCFYNRKSKNGNVYRCYLGPEISKDICKEMGVEYKGKK